MNKLIKTDVDGLMKDSNSGAILNTDNAKLAAYRKQKQLAISSGNNINRLDKLENDMADIKSMLQQLLKR